MKHADKRSKHLSGGMYGVLSIGVCAGPCADAAARSRQRHRHREQSTAVRAQGARAGEDHAQHLRDLFDQLGIFFRR